jgi:metal-sulfur cluster biosynthetic enzyme
MVETPTTVWLKSEALAPGACTGCQPTPTGAACRNSLEGDPCSEPLFSGDPARLRAALAALSTVLDAEGGRSLVELQFLRSLHVDADEAVLTVSFPLRCGPSRQLADDAFHALRRQLPDTDVYVRHAA